MDTSSEITTKDLKEREEWWRRQRTREAHLLTGTLMEEDGEQEADNAVDEGEDGQEEKEGDGEEENGEEDEKAEAAMGSRAAEDEEEDADTKKQKTNQDDYTARKEKLN